jgi:hypothetical protein
LRRAQAGQLDSDIMPSATRSAGIKKAGIKEGEYCSSLYSRECSFKFDQCPSPFPAVDENVAADQDPELLGRLDNYVEKVKDLEK